jgi:hypothetical protein
MKRTDVVSTAGYRGQVEPLYRPPFIHSGVSHSYSRIRIPPEKLIPWRLTVDSRSTRAGSR